MASFSHIPWLWLGLLAFLGTAQATTVLCARTSDGYLVVAADSLEIRSNRPGPKRSTCKINKYGTVYASFSGITGDEETGFNPKEIASLAMGSCQDTECAVTAFKKAVIQPLIATIENSRKRDGERHFTRLVRSSPLQALIYGTQDGTTMSHMVTFDIKEASGPIDIAVSHERCPGDCTNGSNIFALGSYAVALKSLIDTTASPGWNPTRVLLEAIALEDAQSEEVAGPYSVIEIFPDGRARWVPSYQCECDAIENKPIP